MAPGHTGGRCPPCCDWSVLRFWQVSGRGRYCSPEVNLVPSDEVVDEIFTEAVITLQGLQEVRQVSQNIQTGLSFKQKLRSQLLVCGHSIIYNFPQNRNVMLIN